MDKSSSFGPVNIRSREFIVSLHGPRKESLLLLFSLQVTWMWSILLYLVHNCNVVLLFSVETMSHYLAQAAPAYNSLTQFRLISNL
jgi:hypothetical protein